MTALENQKSVALPEGLELQFAALERRLWKTETLCSIFLGMGALLLSLLVLFVSDHLWETPLWLRIGTTGVGAICVTWLAIRWLQKWVFRPRDHRDLAVLVQQQYRRLGDRLLGIVELADEKERPANFSPALYRAAIHQVALEAQRFDFPSTIDAQPARVSGVVLLCLVLLAVIPAILSPGAALNAFSRWILPTSSIPRLTLVQIQGLPAERIVAHGEAFDLTFSARYLSLWKPRWALGQIPGQPRVLVSASNGDFKMRLSGQVQPGLLKVQVGDARASIRITPMYRPSLKELHASIEYPAYLQYPSSTENAEGGSLAVLDGSRVSFAGRASHPLDAAEVQLPEQPAESLPVQEDGFTSGLLTLPPDDEITFKWRDRFGLASQGPWRLQVRSQKDSPPMLELGGLQKDTALLESEILDLKAIARDDFGVKEMGLKWQSLSDEPSTNQLTPEPFESKASNPREKKMEDVYHFSPALLKVPTDSVVEMRAWATDYYPNRQPSETTVYRVHVLSKERHAELIRQNLESLLTRLEDVTRLEEKVNASTRALQDLPKDKLTSSEATERIRAAKEDQDQNARNLERLADEGKKTLREAFRNPAFSEETLRDWAKNLKDMEQLSQDQMQQALQALSASQSDSEDRGEKLKSAAQKEDEILQALEQMQRKVNKGLDQLQALTLAQRLRKISSDEKGIAERLQRIVPQTIGLFPRELPLRFKDSETYLAGEQEAAQKETQTLQAEIGRFFERTQKESYGQVNKEMSESHISDELDRVRSLITENISMDAMQNLGVWSERLTHWAEVLEPKSESSSNGNGEGGGAKDDALIQELLGLLRVRDREVNLRLRTGMLEKEKSHEQIYREGTKALASTQVEVRQETGKIQGHNPLAELEFPLQDIVDAMRGVEGLLNKPQTDRETDLAQTKTVELLSDVINLINEQQQRSNSKSSSQTASAEEMAFLMQMMAVQANPALSAAKNPNGGGSLAGGSTDRAATSMTGNPAGKAGESRTVNRAGGTTANLPTEFRDALENYFKALEKLEPAP